MNTKQDAFSSPTELQWRQLKENVEAQTNHALVTQLQACGRNRPEILFTSPKSQVEVYVAAPYQVSWVTRLQSYVVPQLAALLFLLFTFFNANTFQPTPAATQMEFALDEGVIAPQDIIDLAEFSKPAQAMETTVPDGDEPLTDYLNYEATYEFDI